MQQRRSGREILDELVEVAVDTAFDRAGDLVERFRQRQVAALTDEQRAIAYPCMQCEQVYPLDQMAMIRSMEQFGVCLNCFRFMENAAREKIAYLSKKAAHNGARNAAKKVGVKVPAPPWEILCVKQEASEAEIKKAYRAVVMQWHPDRLSPEQRPEGQKRIDEATKAKDAMIKARSAPV